MSKKAKTKKREREALLEAYKRKIIEKYVNNEIIDLTIICSPLMPSAGKAREILHKILNLCGPKGKREFKVYLVEKINGFKVFIQIPDSKTAYGLTKRERQLYGVEGEITCDFNVWFLEGENPEELILPTHDFMFNWYDKLRKNIAKGLLFAMVEALIRRRMNPHSIVKTFLSSKVSKEILYETEKFLTTLKWIVLQEDVNYKPPRYMGSKYTLAAYALLEMGFTQQEIRRLIRF